MSLIKEILKTLPVIDSHIYRDHIEVGDKISAYRVVITNPEGRVGKEELILTVEVENIDGVEIPIMTDKQNEWPHIPHQLLMEGFGFIIIDNEENLNDPCS